MLTLTCCQDHILTENLWFVCLETSYSGDERRCYYAWRRQQLKIELLSQWKLEAESRNIWCWISIPLVTDLTINTIWNICMLSWIFDQYKNSTCCQGECLKYSLLIKTNYCLKYFLDNKIWQKVLLLYFLSDIVESNPTCCQGEGRLQLSVEFAA